MAYEVLEHEGQMVLNRLQRVQQGQQLPARFGSVEVDTVVFLLRQQEAAAMQSGISSEQQSEWRLGSLRGMHATEMQPSVHECVEHM